MAAQNTGQEFDGSDSGARPDEAVSWGKIRAGAESVKVCLVIDKWMTMLNFLRTGLRGRNSGISASGGCNLRRATSDGSTMMEVS